METKILKIDLNNSKEIIEKGFLTEAVSLIQSENVVGFPTETVYGLGASCFSELAIKKVFEVKGRPQDNPLIVHVSNMDMVKKIVKEIPSSVEKLCKAFWPGPLTILFNKNKTIPDVVTAGLPTVAVRMPSHPVALALIEQSGHPIAAPSANLSGFPSPTSAQHVYNDLNGRIPLILDGGNCEIGVESTVLDLYQDPPVILRPGGMNYEDLRQYIPKLKIYQKIKKPEELLERPSSPGMKYRHYSPKARVILLEYSPNTLEKNLKDLINEYNLKRIKLGIIHTQSWLNLSKLNIISEEMFTINLLEDDTRFKLDEIVARGLFSALREMDKEQVEVILVEGISEKHKGLAVMNRIRKAASKII